MDDSIRRLGRAAAAGLLSVAALADTAFSQGENGDLPFALQVEKVEFEKKLRTGLTQVLTQYEEALGEVFQRKFTEEAVDGLESVETEKAKVEKDRKAIGNTDPLTFVAENIGRLNEEEVRLEARLSESIWALSDGRTLKLIRGGRIALDGKRENDWGWVVAGPEKFIWGGKFWNSELRDNGLRFHARNWHYPKQSLGAEFIDSIDYNGTPIPLMAREHGKMKLQLAAGLKVLIRDYAGQLDRARKAQLQAGKLDEALAIKKEWERLFEIGDALFGSGIRLGNPSDDIAPRFRTADQLREGLVDTVWRKNDGNAVAFRAKGRAVFKPYTSSPHRTGWEVIDHRTIVWGHRYHVVRFDPRLTSYAAASRNRPEQSTAALEKPR